MVYKEIILEAFNTIKDMIIEYVIRAHWFHYDSRCIQVEPQV